MIFNKLINWIVKKSNNKVNKGDLVGVLVGVLVCGYVWRCFK